MRTLPGTTSPISPKYFSKQNFFFCVKFLQFKKAREISLTDKVVGKMPYFKEEVYRMSRYRMVRHPFLPHWLHFFPSIIENCKTLFTTNAQACKLCVHTHTHTHTHTELCLFSDRVHYSFPVDDPCICTESNWLLVTYP